MRKIRFSYTLEGEPPKGLYAVEWSGGPELTPKELKGFLLIVFHLLGDEIQRLNQEEADRG